MDQNIQAVFEDILNIDLIDIIISNSTRVEEITKIKIRPILLKNQLLYQVSEYKGKQIFHSNYGKEELLNKLPEWFEGLLKQVQIRTSTMQISILVSKKGKATIKKRLVDEKVKQVPLKRQEQLSHNRKKKYILEENIEVGFLIDLGIMTTDGKIVRTKYDKYKQINRYLEFIQDVLVHLDKDRELTIIDFGCGKSYLTFAMYYYLNELKGYCANIIGLDLKEDVIEHCNELSRRYGYDRLKFLKGDIASYEECNQVDMVVTLHACDTATDYALYKAVSWGANVILSVPCCQHEINRQLQAPILKPIVKYGLLQERMAALITDGMRASLLEQQGYKVQVLEFIDMEHTPKNILIRAVKDTKEKQNQNRWKEYEECREFLNITPTLYQLFQEDRKHV